MRRRLAILEAQAAVALRGHQDAATQDSGPVEQGRPEPGNQARCSVDARLRRCGPCWPTFRPSLPNAGQCVPGRDGYLLALTYGPDSDWVKNVLAAGGCELVTRGAPSAWSRPIGSRREPAWHPSSRAAGAPADRCGRLLSLKTHPPLARTRRASHDRDVAGNRMAIIRSCRCGHDLGWIAHGGHGSRRRASVPFSRRRAVTSADAVTRIGGQWCADSWRSRRTDSRTRGEVEAHEIDPNLRPKSGPSHVVGHCS